MLKGNHMVTDQTPSLQELLNKDFTSCTKSNEEDAQEIEPKPVFIHAQTSKRRNLNNNT